MKKNTKAASASPRPARASRKSLPTPAPGAEDGKFSIVGVGASAGGLEALEHFLRPVPVPCGLAFVIVQHLDPTHKGIMTVEKSVTTRDGRWFAKRLMPYRTLDDRIKAVVLTFTDLSLARRLEGELRAKP